MGNNETSLSEQFVTFTLAGEEYAVDVFKVKEVIDPPAITQVPNMPDFIPGVINLRGIVTPIVDLGFKLGLGKTEQTTDTRILIIQTELDGVDTSIGIIADKVSEVIHISSDELLAPPEMGTRIRSEFLIGMSETASDHFLLILDIDKVLETEEMLHVVEQAEDSSSAESEENQTEEDGDTELENDRNEQE